MRVRMRLALVFALLGLVAPFFVGFGATPAGALSLEYTATRRCNMQARCVEYAVQIEQQTYNGTGYVRADAHVRCMNAAGEPYSCWGVGDPVAVTIFRNDQAWTGYRSCGTFNGTTCRYPQFHAYSPFVEMTGNDAWRARLRVTAGVVTFYGQDYPVTVMTESIALWG